MLHVFDAAQPPHCDLEREGPSVRSQHDRLPFHHEVAHRHGPRPFDDFGQPLRHVLQLPRENPDVIAALVDLNARPVQLVLKGRLP